MPSNDGISLLLYAMEKEEDDKLFARWIAGPQLQYGYEEFKELLKPVRMDEKKTMEDIDSFMKNTAWEKVQIEG